MMTCREDRFPVSVLNADANSKIASDLDGTRNWLIPMRVSYAGRRRMRESEPPLTVF